MQKELNQAAAVGYRVLAGSPTSGDEMAIILEKVAQYRGGRDSGAGRYNLRRGQQRLSQSLAARVRH